jgi:hypothetical protein
MVRFGEIDVVGVVDRNATVVQLTVMLPDSSYFEVPLGATGSSKRAPKDVFDADLGYEYALARALQNLSRQVRSRADAKLERKYA